MNNLVKRFSGKIDGCISGFDRIVFKGIIMPLMIGAGAMDFCRSNGILFKDYKQWMQTQTAGIIQSADDYAKSNCGQGIIYLPTWRIRKEEVAHERQQAEQIESGLIGVWSCLESASSFRARYCEEAGYPQLQKYPTRCKHLYFYFDHPEFGFMNIRLQTWFPYPIQICLNGREWLRRSLEKSQVDFCAHGNKFTYISDYHEAQHLFNTQLDACFPELLNGFLPAVFPMMTDVLGPHLSYYWTLWQSEWATDLIFTSPSELNDITNSLLRHAHMTGTSTQVLRYMDHPLTKAGIPYINSNDQVQTRVKSFNDGVRVRHWVDTNSVKVYNEQNVLRVETTINDPSKFKVFQHKQHQPSDESKSRLPMRKGVMDIPLRAQVSQEVNDRMMNDLSTLKEQSPVRDLIEKVTCAEKQNGKQFRGLDPLGKDRDLLNAISSREFKISGLSNKMLREKLVGTDFGKGYTDKQLSAKVSRILRLLRVHGIIKKLPKQNKYQLTLKGMKLTNSINAFLAASTEKLVDLAA